MNENVSGNASKSILGNLASMDINVHLTWQSALYLFLVIALGATSFFVAKKLI